MRILESEKTGFSKYREVSDLRIQFLCEYRLFLHQKIGDESTKASLEGQRLHSKFCGDHQNGMSQRPVLPLIIMILAVVIGLLWILW